MAKRVILGYDENGNPIYSVPAHGNYVNPDLQPGKYDGRSAALKNPELAPARNSPDIRPDGSVAPGPSRARKGAYQQRPDGSIAPGSALPRERYRQNAGLSAAERVVLTDERFKSFSQENLAEGGNPKLAVDYSKDPYSTTVPGQPGYDQSKDPFHQTPKQKAKAAENKAKAEKEKALYERHGLGEWWLKSRGEKTGGSGLDSVHSDASEARRLQRQLDDERKWAESLYPGAGGRQHSTGGTNLGEPAWSGSGEGASHFGTFEWECRSGTIVGENGVELVAVLEQWNIYDGQ
jgi:hypothetical protein